MVYTSHLWWLGGWVIIAIPTLKPQNHSEEKHQADNLALKDDHEAGGNTEALGRFGEKHRGSPWMPTENRLETAEDWDAVQVSSVSGIC